MKWIELRIKHWVIFLVLLLGIVLVLFLLNNGRPLGVADPKPEFSVIMDECRFDGSNVTKGIFSFLFNITLKNETRLPAQFVLKTKDVFIYDYNITREYELDRIHYPNETINASFVIEDVYKNYVYLPNENFNVELFYCEFTDSQKDYLNDTIPFHEALDRYCLSIFDYAKAYGVPYIHVVVQNPGIQCSVIIRDVEGNILIYEK